MKKQFWIAVLACGISVLGGCDRSSEAESEIANAEELNLQEDASAEKLIERYNSMHSMCRGEWDTSSSENEDEQACALRDKIAERLTNADYCFLQSEQAWLSCEATEAAEAAEAAEAVIVAKKSCYDYLYERAWDEGFNFEYHRLQTHENWKRRYGDNYIHQYIVRRIRNGRVVGDPFFKHCIVSKSSLEVLRVVNSDIGA